MRGSDFVFDSIDEMHYKCNKISLNHSSLYIGSSEWIKNKKAIINPKNNNDKCFQYTIISALNHRYYLINYR